VSRRSSATSSTTAARGLTFGITVLPGLEVIDHLTGLADIQFLGTAVELVLAFILKVQIETIGNGMEGTKLTASCGPWIAIPVAVGVIVRRSLLMVTNSTNSTSLGIPRRRLLLQGDLGLLVQTGDFMLEPPWVGE
jgi:hypothetical protein